MDNVKDLLGSFCLTVLQVAFLLFWMLGCQPKDVRIHDGSGDENWPAYKGDVSSSSYSGLDHIHKGNVDQLEVVWSYRTGDVPEGARSTMQTNPVIVDGVLYGASPRLNIFAVDAATGDEQWVFDPFEGRGGGGILRGLMYWEEAEEKRLLFTAGNGLYALDAETGTPVSSFGEAGRVDLNTGLGRDSDEISVRATSPGVIYEDLLILGSAVGESYGSAPGHIRAYNVRTGEMVWIFHTIPGPSEPGFESWEGMDEEALAARGGVNNWAGMSLDAGRGIVYIPLGSPVYDFYGGDRPGANLYGNSLLALDAAGGEYIWHYQTVHHDLWDYDLPAPPNLLTVRRGGKRMDVVAQVTKTGFTFVFDRATGEPVFPVEERPVPGSNLEGEHPWPTQPFPLKPEPFARQRLVEEDITSVIPEARDSIRNEFLRYRNEGLFTPPDPAGTIHFPSTVGGANWGGAAHDPDAGILYVNGNELPEVITLERMAGGDSSASSRETLFGQGESYYRQTCAMCHGNRLEGRHPDFPGLMDLADTHSRQEVLQVIGEGRGRMPGFPGITDEEEQAILAFLFDEKRESAKPDKSSLSERGEEARAENSPYINTTAYRDFRDSRGYPAITPPWGTLNAIDLNEGEILWQVPLGEFSELTEQGIPPTGMESWGGPIATAGGLVFIGGTADKKFRAFDKDTGELLWETPLPTGGFATPASYMVGGTQFIVIAVGGGRGTSSGDYYIAFALPEAHR